MYVFYHILGLKKAIVSSWRNVRCFMAYYKFIECKCCIFSIIINYLGNNALRKTTMHIQNSLYKWIINMYPRTFSEWYIKHNNGLNSN